MIYIFYGKDTYRSRERVRELIASFRTKFGEGVSLERFDAQERDMNKLAQTMGGQSLFSEKKIVVVEYAFSGVKNFDVLKNSIAYIKDLKDTLLILWDRELDAKNLTHVKEIEKYAEKIQEFKPLGPAELARWIQDGAKKRNISLTEDSMMRLQMRGADLWALSNELDKLAVHARSEGAHAPLEEKTVFQLGDTFFIHKKNALHTLLRLFMQGHDDAALFGYLTNYTRTLSIVKLHSEKGKSIPATFGIHPFVVKKSTSLVRNIDTKNLHATLNLFFKEDYYIKTGASRAKESLIRMMIS